MPPIADKPPEEVEVDEALVRSLLHSQHPDLAELELRTVDAGWDNVVVRLGDDLAVRLPRRQMGADLAANEHRWLPILAPMLPLPVPAPIRIGRPEGGYPWAWSVVPWFAGESALRAAPDDPAAAAVVLGRFLRALHVPAPSAAPRSALRGIPLIERDELTRAWIDQLADELDAPAVRRSWARHVALPLHAGPPTWVHGDLHPHNLVVHEGAVAAVLDFGDLNAGDPATDLAIAWMLLPPADRLVLRQVSGADEATWARGRGWALVLGLALWAHAAAEPEFARAGRSTIEAVLADPT